MNGQPAPYLVQTRKKADDKETTIGQKLLPRTKHIWFAQILLSKWKSQRNSIVNFAHSLFIVVHGERERRQCCMDALSNVINLKEVQISQNHQMEHHRFSRNHASFVFYVDRNGLQDCVRIKLPTSVK